jgi:hypothetical protein
MKAYTEIRNEITANTTKIAELEAAADKLMKKAEAAAAATWGERKAIHASVTDAEEAQAVKMYTEAENLKAINSILEESEKAAFCEYVKPIISDIMQKYAGKQYGEKTRKRIQDAAHAENIGFYFDGYGCCDTVHVYCMNPENGCKAWNMPEVTMYSTDADGKRAEFISGKNAIQNFNNIEFSYYYKYTENPENKSEELKQAYEEFKKLVELASNAESKLNSLIPESGKHIHVIGHLSPWTKVY